MERTVRTVAIYARVSTEHEAQISALGNQIQYYDEILARHPEWTLYDRYIDEGITGTSINKRKNFLRMMEDASKGKFDLIITREVSRFARNTVDTLQQTRLLKAQKVEVWFIDDNIWTMNDMDGELRLSIMATLAQNESKKTSMRVKAGQAISFQNGVLYGNGNILGYDRVGKDLILNKEQAKTVRRIFDLYLQGNGIRKIQNIMEQEGYLTSSGKETWQAGNILRIIRNPFYCGRIEYRKQFVPDYLTQKKINNHGDVEKVYVQGNHQTIITEEEFDRVQQILASKSTKKDGKNVGKPLAENMWVRKLRCTCGHAMNRRASYTSKKGDKSYTFQCYHQLRNGTVQYRQKHGLSTEGLCENSCFQGWKLDVQAQFVFGKLLSNKQNIYEQAMTMIKDCVDNCVEEDNSKEQLEETIVAIDRLKLKIDNLLDMYTDGDISKEMFLSKKQKLENNIAELEVKKKQFKENLVNNQEKIDNYNRLESLDALLKMKVFDDNIKIPETVIDAYVDKIIYDKGTFKWYLNPRQGNAIMNLDLEIVGDKKNHTVNNAKDTKLPSQVDTSTGCYKRSTEIENGLYIGFFNIPKHYLKSKNTLFYPENGFRLPDSISLELYIA